MARFAAPTLQFFDDNGDPLAAGKLTFYATNTLTLKNTYSDDALTVANTNPVVADAAGRFGNIFLEAGTYRVVLKNSADVQIWDRDPVEGPIGSSGAIDEKTGNYTLTIADATKVIAANATSAAVTITLLPAATATDGYEVTIKKTDSSTNTVTIDGDGSETIDGANTLVLTEQYQSVTIRSDGANWQRVGFSVKPDASRLIGTDSSGRFDSISVTGNDIALSSSSIRGNFPRGHLWGLGIANNSTDSDHDIDIAVGECRSGADSDDLVLSAALTKQIDAAWAAGDDAGGLFDGTVANTTVYHVFLIKKDSDGTIDAGFDTSVTAANIPDGYTAHRRIGSVKTNSSANIRAFSQHEDEFLWSSPTLDVDNSNPGTSAVSQTLEVPTGYVLDALFLAGLVGGTATTPIVYYSPLDITDLAPSNTVAPLGYNVVVGGSSGGELSGPHRVRTNTSGQIRRRVSASVSDTRVRIVTLGWIDTRGRYS